MQNWKTIWGKRAAGNTEGTLQSLINLDGFDTGAGTIRENAWRGYVMDIAHRLNMAPGHSVFEIGCGAGAFLYPLHEAGLRVAGLDYSAPLIKAARAAMPDGDFREAEAAEFSPSPQCYDFIVANSVFHYFTGEHYAMAVLEQMLSAARKAVAVLEIPDIDRQSEAETTRRALLSASEYQEKYAGLAHLYFHRTNLCEVAERNGFSVEILDQSIDGYAQNGFRFNCLMRRKCNTNLS